MVRSTTRTPQASSTLRICVGLSSQSKISRSISWALQCDAISSSMPEPTQEAASGAGRFCVTAPNGSAPALRVSS